MYPYSLVGNCRASALIHTSGSIDWLCLPRPDSPPIFGKLLDPSGGFFAIELATTGEEPHPKYDQKYIPNSNVVTTIITDYKQNSVKITDFLPRFYQDQSTIFRPTAVFRMIETVSGRPRIRIRCQPSEGWSKQPATPRINGNELTYPINVIDGHDVLRLRSTIPLNLISSEIPFELSESAYLCLAWNEELLEPLQTHTLPQLCRRFLTRTLDYWNGWVKHCSIPSLYQKETIRSALTLKLHCYEDTGAILAALTTSLPEQPGRERNWDYRYCWLRDAYFVLSAFYKLGHFEEMEGFIKFLLDIITENHEHSRERLRPVYRLDRSLPLPELEHHGWNGHMKSSPVRSGNQAADHVQNDVYGEMILTLSPIYFDERFHQLRTPQTELLLSRLARLCQRNTGKPDAGLWELRNGWQEHSFSNLMCWAGLERMYRIQSQGVYLQDLDMNLAEAKAKAEASIRAAVHDGSLRNGPKDPTMDAALLALPILGFPDLELSNKTVAEIQKQLSITTPDSTTHSGFLYRYRRNDDFGQPESAFVICSFWLVQALAKTGKLDEARSIMNAAIESGNPVGLLSEHFIPEKRLQLGNFPQAYSHVGLINAAFAVSPAWEEV